MNDLGLFKFDFTVAAGEYSWYSWDYSIACKKTRKVVLMRDKNTHKWIKWTTQHHGTCLHDTLWLQCDGTDREVLERCICEYFEIFL